MNIYLELTEEFNRGGLRAVICSGQAVVLHRLAIMSKDGDWILREDQESLSRVLSVLAARGATYRFGAPLDLRWLRHGWSSHLEFQHGNLRVRTDFFTRPPRLNANDLAKMWKTQQGRNPPFVGLKELAELKKTNREKDYAVIGELARNLPTLLERMLYSRSARDLLKMKEEGPGTWAQAVKIREALQSAGGGRDPLEVALDHERRQLMRVNEERLDRYESSAAKWAKCWPDVTRKLGGLPLQEAHAAMVSAAEDALPYEP
mgnify:CR=1 FL=1|jgi:hypothetical protein